MWERDLKEWQWIMGVNLWGVIHGVHAFLPSMIRDGHEGHIVNTASAAGLAPGSGIYGVTKHAVVAMSEAIHTQLRTVRAKIDVSVLCPGWVNTSIMDSGRNRPEHLATGHPLSDADVERRDAGVRQLMRMGMEPAEVAEGVIAAIREPRFYVLAMKPDFKERFLEVVQRRANDIIEQRSPTPPEITR